MEQVLIFILVVVAVALIALVLFQHGKGADIGATFGSGASNTVFGSQGSTSFLFKLTGGLAIIFFVICIVLTHMASNDARQSLGNAIEQQAQNIAPANASSVEKQVVLPSSVPDIKTTTPDTRKNNSTVPVVPEK